MVLSISAWRDIIWKQHVNASKQGLGLLDLLKHRKTLNYSFKDMDIIVPPTQ